MLLFLVIRSAQPARNRSSSQAFFVFAFFCTFLQFSALCNKLSTVFSMHSTLFAQNTRGGAAW
jgi:hypothetical protein